MSCIVDKDTLTDKLVNDDIIPSCTISIKNTSKILTLVSRDDSNEVILPLAFWYDVKKKYEAKHEYVMTRLDKNRKYDMIDFSINPQLKPIQKEVLNDVIKELNIKPMCYLKGGTGIGKSRVSACVIHKYKYKTAIIMHSTTYIHQWMNELNTISTARVYIVPEGKITSLPEDYDVYLIMALRCKNISNKDLCKFGLLIVEEAKYMCTAQGIVQILRFFPAMILAICAEDKRDDEFNSLFNPLFGTTRVVKEDIKPLTIIKVDMPYKPKDIRQTKGPYQGRFDWIAMGTELYGTCTPYNIKVAEILYKFSNNYRIMGISTRVEQINIIYDILTNMGCSVTKYVGGIKQVENCRVILAIRQKGEVGFDAANQIIDYDGVEVNMVAFLGSMKKKQQGTGRSRSDNPVVIEFVPNHSICKRHWEESKKYYDTRNPTYKTYNISTI